MSNRALMGWLLVGAFSASVSCGSNGGNGGVPRGYGLACTTDNECTGFSLLCSPDDKCVQCLGVDDCERTESCMSGLCKAPESCKDSRDCSSNLVCNETVGVCVECLESRDCGTGLKCAAQHCVSQQTCDFTSDCEDGLLCDADAGICVSCRTDNDCPSRRVCEDNECILPAPVGEGGEGGTGATGGTPSTSGSQNGGTPNGGTPSAGTGGTRGGTGGSAGNGGSGGTLPDPCDCTLGDVCTLDERCVAPSVVDDLYDCDNQILEIEGRSGPWAGDADLDINFMQGFGNPGSGWVDNTCAAWATCGTGQPAVDTDFAFIGFLLNDGSVYSLANYTGIQIVLESANDIQVVLKTIGGGYFQYTLPSVTGSNSRTAPFANMLPMNNSAEQVLNLNTVTEVQFSPTTPEDCGYAIHRVELYGAF